MLKKGARNSTISARVWATFFLQGLLQLQGESGVEVGVMLMDQVKTQSSQMILRWSILEAAALFQLQIEETKQFERFNSILMTAHTNTGLAFHQVKWCDYFLIYLYLLLGPIFEISKPFIQSFDWWVANQRLESMVHI